MLGNISSYSQQINIKKETIIEKIRKSKEILGMDIKLIEELNSYLGTKYNSLKDFSIENLTDLSNTLGVYSDRVNEILSITKNVTKETINDFKEFKGITKEEIDLFLKNREEYIKLLVEGKLDEYLEKLKEEA